MSRELVAVRRCFSTSLAGLELLCNTQLAMLDIGNGNIIGVTYTNRNAVTYVAIFTVWRIL